MSNNAEAETDEPPPSILCLNDDCLYHIFDWLPNLGTQTQLARTCRRFRTIILHKWVNSHRFDVLDLECLHNLLPELEDLKYFLQQMRKHFNSVIISNGCLMAFLKDLKQMHITKLPNVFGFSYNSDDIDCYPTDDNMETLTKLLPNLRKLYFTQPIRGCHIANFKQLNELLLYDDEHKAFELQQKYLDEICMSLKQLRVLDIRAYDSISELRLDKCIAHLSNITVLKLNLATLKTVLPAVLQLPSLRKLTVLLDNEFNVSNVDNVDTYDYKIYETREFFQILETKGAEIVGMAVDAYYMPLEDGWDKDISVHTYNKLEKLVICTWLAPPDSLVRYVSMTNLRMLCCRHWTQLTDEIILKFIKHCRRLRHLDVSYCKGLTAQLPTAALSILKAQKPQPQQPLIVHYVLSGFEDQVDANISFWLQHAKYIELTKDFPPNGEPGLSYVERGYEFDFE